MVIATPGIMEIHHAVATFARPSATICPHDGVGGGMPAPRKLSDASVRMTRPTCNVSMTMNELKTLGIM